MSLYRKIQSVRAQIIDTETLLRMVSDHPIMARGFTTKVALLKQELENLPVIEHEPKVKLLFSGGAVVGSQGVKANFLSKTLAPFQEMIKTHFAMLRFGNVGKRGQAKNAVDTELYLTALPTGSFGVELSQLETTDLFSSVEVSEAIKQVITLIANTSSNDESFEAAIKNLPKRNLGNLKKFLHEIANENSILKLESSEIVVEIPSEKIKEAYDRVSSTSLDREELFIKGIFRGLLLDSGKFEIQDEAGVKYSGFVRDDISEEQLVQYNSFLNSYCKIHLAMQKTVFKTGNEKIDYELLEITAL